MATQLMAGLSVGVLSVTGASLLMYGMTAPGGITNPVDLAALALGALILVGVVLLVRRTGPVTPR